METIASFQNIFIFLEFISIFFIYFNCWVYLLEKIKLWICYMIDDEVLRLFYMIKWKQSTLRGDICVKQTTLSNNIAPNFKILYNIFIDNLINQAKWTIVPVETCNRFFKSPSLDAILENLLIKMQWYRTNVETHFDQCWV